MKKADLEPLFLEMKELERWIDPKPDPAEWPPRGWQYHPQIPGSLYRVTTESELREELFGSEQKTAWLESAKARLEEIKLLFTSYFFPKPKEEGTERKQKYGFAVMLKTGIQRKFDLPALASVVAECQKLAVENDLSVNVEEKVIEWEPKLKLKEYRELPQVIREQFEAALILTPEKPKFEIVREEFADEA